MEKISEKDKEVSSKEDVVGGIIDDFLSYILVPVGQLGILFLLMVIYLATLVDGGVEKISPIKL